MQLPRTVFRLTLNGLARIERVMRSKDDVVHAGQDHRGFNLRLIARRPAAQRVGQCRFTGINVEGSPAELAFLQQS